MPTPDEARFWRRMARVQGCLAWLSGLTLIPFIMAALVVLIIILTVRG